MAKTGNMLESPSGQQMETPRSIVKKEKKRKCLCSRYFSIKIITMASTSHQIRDLDDLFIRKSILGAMKENSVDLLSTSWRDPFTPLLQVMLKQHWRV